MKDKKYYYICDPNLPVSRKKGRGRQKIVRFHTNTGGSYGT